MATPNEKTGSSVFLDTTSAQFALDKLNKKIDEYDRLLKKTNLSNRELASLQKSRADAAQKAAKIQAQVEKGLGSSITEQIKYVRDLNREVKSLAVGTKEWNAAVKKLSEANKVLAEMKQRANDVGQAQKEAAKSASFLGSFFGNVAAQLVAKLGNAISDFFAGTAEEVFAAEEAVSNLQNALENAGRMDLFGEFLAEADEFAEKFRRLDNDDITGVFTRLIDYGKLTKSQIKETTEVIIDYAAKQKISLESSADQIIKALEGSARGLKSYGVTVKESQSFTERYSAVVDQMGQKIKGAELAFERTSKGALQTWGQRINDLKERVGSFVFGLVGLEEQQLKNAISAKKDADQGKILVARYEELSKKTNLTAAEKAELNTITLKLSDTFGSSVLEINKETGAMTVNIEKTKELIKQKLLLANNKAAELAAKLNAAQDRLANSTSNLTEQTQLLSAAEKEAGMSAEEVNKLFDSSDKAKRRIGDDPNLRRVFDLSVEIARGSRVVEQYESEIDDLKESLEELGFTAEDVKNLFNPSDPNKTIGIAPPPDDGKKERDEARKKELEDLKRLAEEIEKIRTDLRLANADQETKEIEATLQKYDRLRELAHGHYQYLLTLANLRGAEILAIEDKYDEERERKEREKRKADEKKVQDALADRARQAGAQGPAGGTPQNDPARISRDQLAALQLRYLKASNLERLKAHKDLLDRERDLALANTELTENEKKVIEEQYRQMKMEAEIEFYTQLFDTLMSFAQGVADITSLSNEAKKNEEDAELARVEKNNNKKKASEQKLVNNKLISQQEYNRRAKALDDQYNAQVAATKKKQFQRQQQADIVAAIISGSQAVLSALQTKPFLLGLALATVAAIKTKKEIDVIKSQPVPEFSIGGKLDGPSHSEGGMPVINPRTGRKEAEVEGGEVILSKDTVKNNPEVVGALLHSSMKLRGATIKPFWKTQPYKTIDVTGLSDTIRRVRQFETGGIFPSQSSTDAPASSGQEIAIPELQGLAEAITVLNARMAEPTRAYVVFSDVEVAQDKIDQIRNDAVFK